MSNANLNFDLCIYWVEIAVNSHVTLGNHDQTSVQGLSWVIIIEDQLCQYGSENNRTRQKKTNYVHTEVKIIGQDKRFLIFGWLIQTECRGPAQSAPCRLSWANRSETLHTRKFIVRQCRKVEVKRIRRDEINGGL